MNSTTYIEQAESFLAKHGITLSMREGTQTAPWEKAGIHYRVTLRRPNWHLVHWPNEGRSTTFDFWGSINDAHAGVQPDAYSVLACISSDVHCPESFTDFCAEYGYDEDSRKAEKTFYRCRNFAKKLRAFFTPEEIEDLSEIQ